MRKILLSSECEHFTHLTTALSITAACILGAAEAPDIIVTIASVMALVLCVYSIYYGMWRSIQREKGL